MNGLGQGIGLGTYTHPTYLLIEYILISVLGIKVIPRKGGRDALGDEL
jgi:hypothetical protein